MRSLEKVLSKLEGRLYRIERNTVTGNYFLQIGIPSTWVYKGTKLIKIEEVAKSKSAVMLNIFTEDDDIVVDDLIDFVNIIVETNEKIAKKEEEFKKMMEDAKNELIEKQKEFYGDLDNLKEESFKKFNMDDDAPKKIKKESKKVVLEEEISEEEVETVNSPDETLSELSDKIS